MAQKVTLEDTQAYIGREIAFEGVDEISRNDIRRKCEVYCFYCPLHSDEDGAKLHGYRSITAPSTMIGLWSMPAYWTPGEPIFYGPDLPEKGGGIRMDIPTPFTKAVNASSEWEYFEPLYPGDRLHGVWKLTDIKPRRTRLGEGAFLTYEATLWKHSGELVAKNRNSTFTYNEDPERVKEAQSAPRDDAPVIITPPPMTPPEMDWSKQIYFEDVSVGQEIPPFTIWLSYQRIVMSVAVDRMFSGVHHNRDFARAQGLDDIIFNTRGYEFTFEVTMRRWIGLDGRIRKLGPFRMIQNTHPGDTFTCRGKVTNKEIKEGQGLVYLDLWDETQRRGEVARGEAVVSLPIRS